MARLALALLLLAGLALPARVDAQSAPTDWRDQAIYFVMTDRFKNGDLSNDGDAATGRPDWWQGGDLRGVLQELDYIRGLGMTAIWLTPPTRQTRGGYHGYWTLDHYAIDPHLGDLATLRELVRTAHEKRMRVVLDVVLNHVGYDHPWLTDGAHAEWFHPRCEIVFSVQESVERCWLAGLPDLNTEHPAVRAFLIEWSLWLARESGVDGFRLDTARHVPADFLREWSAALKQERPDFWILGEVFVDDYREQAPYLDAGLDAVTDFFTYRNVARAFSTDDLTWLRLPPPVAESFLGARANARATFLDNHDVPRFVGARAPDALTLAKLRQALVYLFAAPGTPVLYYGTEVALAGGADPDNRRGMAWDAGPNDALREHLRRVAALRQEQSALRSGTWVRLAAERELFAFARLDADRGEAVVVALNGGDGPLETELALDELTLGADITAQALLEVGTAQLAGGALRIALPARAAQLVLLAPPRAETPTPEGAPLLPALAVALAALVIATVVATRFIRRA